ncbi:retrovirus-related Pol polyprotein from type-1 retrotransposable element R2 [Nephila pilipes]|uniref:Retrovirus-related Pol polyprotein from type-1 retrotransposable element R2 n=1 Tax=Nephila pilipes TaxID=299642 RepID=A0A8X6JGK3_NEPPI|nr:retrovirus-related Pol polyprotein from type-1 retrotransposable element R2 [Nephila pilipes]
MCRVCSKGPAPYKTIAEHYKYAHNLSISSSIQDDLTTQINIPAMDFVSSTRKHTRNFIQQKPVSHSSNLKPKQNSEKAPISNSNNTSRSAAKPLHNLKIISRPELRGTGTSKLVLLPATSNKQPPAPSTNKAKAQQGNNSNKPKVHSDRPLPTTKATQITSNSNIITTIAEIHSNVDSSSDEEAQAKICNQCGFVAHKMGGLKLHYFRAHQLKKIPKQKLAILDSQSIKPIANSPRTINTISSVPQKSHPPSSSELKTIPKTASKEKTQEKNNQQEETHKQDNPNQERHPSAPYDIPINTQEFTNSSRKAPPSTQFHSTGDHPSTSINPPPIDRNHHAEYPYVSFNNNILKYYLPVPLKINCPFKNCSASFGTKAWFLTNSSIKKHLNIFHKCPPSSVEFYCFFCKKKIKKSPALHQCLKGNLIIPKAPIVDDSEWTCEICNTFSTTSRLGKQNHLASHKREQIRKNAPPLIIPESNAELKKKRRKKVTSLADGPPGDTRLAPPLLSVNLDRQGVQPEPTIPAQDDEEDDPSNKIDIPILSVLSSFLDPLDALIEVDDLENAMSAFENLMDGITTAVQEHFHLPLQSTDPSKKKAGKSRKNFDPMNAQEVQKLYKWNRRRCVRSIACPTSNRCTITKEALSAHFTNAWGAPNEEFILHGSAVQDRPPILESLDPEFVFSCLQSSENSAPGSDQISYRQWREVDPRCLALSKIFNICIKLKDVPKAWKISNCILIHKKGDQSMIENWRPIALSNTV